MRMQRSNPTLRPSRRAHMVQNADIASRCAVDQFVLVQMNGIEQRKAESWLSLHWRDT